MSVTIPALTRRAIPAVFATTLAVNFVGAAAIPASAATTVPLRSLLRACDFSPLPGGAAQSRASASAVIRVSGGTVAADVQISEPGTPGAHFDVALIQMPHAATSPCNVPGPGVAVTGVNADGVGQASPTVQDSLRSGTTGVWLFIQRPSPTSQSPAEYYTSDFIAPV
ncbi:hypothetical protein GCM10009641_12160 [Mycobacterium cookii]|uniref:Secreted protein n=1 Tax=Mycobacterium cookii TaxID=1775 RepID=A0A7I7KYU9_9MYCO|nr:hypothetical protein [Mycobacterium cookii]MCV7331716.1 hypothetical protein [Mycobacterium cookii]BBX47017.1 hypothetical protein MCOO_30320 [Mycobacterium cookii]